MPVITLISDWGDKDHYIGAVKGAILSRMPEVVIVDISHHIPPFDIEQAAFVLKNAYPDFPEGTIHIIGVSTEESEKFGHTAIELDGQFFIGNDNGVFTLLTNKRPDKIIELTINQDSDYFTFSTRDRFVKAAVHIARGNRIDDLGTPKAKLTEKFLLNPVIDSNLIKGHVVYIDRYENVITNITEPQFREVQKNRKFSLVFRTYEINRISKSYTDVAPGEIVALFGSSGNLEIAINQGNAAGLLGLDYKDMIRIEFE
jgi:S-adenosyl-L-methionine hydrolase (adenosine-forming)